MTTKKSWKCPKCRSTKYEEGHMKIGPVFKSHHLGFRSHMHSPYADHVNEQSVFVCTKCGYCEMYFDVEELKRKTTNK